ncbi:MAG: hypothetical protein HY810_09030 [Candidatus Omnitrophica bacterium]|nr:hypothetical protein [Candidatus Omnitrophota bacterium]
MQENVMEYLQVFFRRKQFFIYPFLITMFVSIVLSFILPKTYISRSVILIEEEDVINPLVSGLAISSSAADRMRAIREQILGWHSLVKLVDMLDLDAKVKSALEYENLLRGIRENIIVEMPRPQIVAISCLGDNAIEVQKVVKALTDIFIQQNIKSQTRETDVAVSFLKDQLKLYHKKIKEDEIRRAQEQLDNLLLDSKESHPMVKELRTRISKLTDEVDNEQQPQSFKIPKETSNDELLSMLILNKLNSEDSGQDMVTLMKEKDAILNSRQVSGLPLDAQVNQEIYAMLLQRLETAQITKQLEDFKDASRFTILDPARVPLKPEKPDKLQFLLIGMALGAAVGAGCVFLVERLDQSFKNINEVKAAFGLPVLGGISTIVTEKEYETKKHNVKFIYTLMGGFFILMIVVVFLFSFLD